MGRPKSFSREDVLEKAMPVFWKQGWSQPVDATPSDMNSISRGGVYGTRKTEQAFH